MPPNSSGSFFVFFSSATANGTDAVTITATLKSATGTPSQDFVDFTASPAGVLSDAHVKGSASGVTTTRLTSMAGGTVTVTVTAQHGEVTGSTVAQLQAAAARADKLSHTQSHAP